MTERAAALRVVAGEPLAFPRGSRCGRCTDGKPVLGEIYRSRSFGLRRAVLNILRLKYKVSAAI